jgi:phosphoribosylglycinamide formyltransferase-1
MDSGPIIMQGAVAVRDDDTPDYSQRAFSKLSIRSIRTAAIGRQRPHRIENGHCKTDAGSPDDALISPKSSSYASIR